MLKGLGLALIFSCGALAGWGKARSLTQRARDLSRWQDFLRQLRLSLETTRAAPREIVRMLARQSAFADFAGVQRMAEAFRESGSFARAAAAAVGQGRPGPAEELLLSLGDSVGIKPLEDQLSALDQAILLLEGETERAWEESRRMGTLFQRMGALLGLLAVILLA